MPKLHENDKQQITDLILNSADATKEYWSSPIGSVQEATAKNRMKSVINDWIDWIESSR